jgi:hypothetical protein
MCMICLDNKKETRHVNLYVIGSEGLDVCHDCEMKIVDYIRDLIRDGHLKIKEEWLQTKVCTCGHKRCEHNKFIGGLFKGCSICGCSNFE